MDPERAELAAVAARVDSLEKEVRIWRNASVAVIIVACTLGVIGARSQRGSGTRAEKVEAQEIDLTRPGSSAHMHLDASGIRLYYGRNDPDFSVNDLGGIAVVSLANPGNPDHAGLSLMPTNLSLVDLSGYDTEIGVTPLVAMRTGEKRQTSAASIIMFGNDKNRTVIWRAPIQ